ncbi:MAG: hypothetical protein ACXWB2_15690 [Acidimicrobiales bacterium]
MSITLTSIRPRGAVGDLAELERVAEVWCSALDPALLEGADAADGAERLAVVVRKLEAAKLLLARRAEEGNAYAARAHSAPDWFATINGISRAEARRALDTAKRLEECHDTRAAFAAGEISRDEADAVSGAATVDPGCERRLLDAATARHDLRETRDAADRVRRSARSAEDEAACHARLHKTRGLRIGQSPDGHVELRGQFIPAAFATVKPVIDAFMKQRLDRARRENTRDGWDAYRADAFLDAIAASASGGARRSPDPTPEAAAPSEPVGPTPASVPEADTADHPEGRLFAPGGDIAKADGLDPKVNWNLVVLVDGIALKRGYTAPGEICEIPGIGSIPIAWVHQLLPAAHAEMLIHDSVDIRAYATSTRHRTRPVDLAVRVRDRACTVPRCHLDVSELDHITDFADTHDTSVENIHGMCNHDHDDKTYRNAIFERDDTHWRWWPPGTDPTTTPPMTAPIGRHLTAWNLDHLPSHDPGTALEGRSTESPAVS